MNSKYLPIITKILSNEPNFINNYKNINSFCNGQENDKIITVQF